MSECRLLGGGLVGFGWVAYAMCEGAVIGWCRFFFLEQEPAACGEDSNLDLVSVCSEEAGLQSDGNLFRLARYV